MLHLREIVRLTEADAGPTGSATLTLDDRRRSRLRFLLDDGREAALFLPRGSILRDGELLLADSGEVVVVRAAPEHLSVARAPDPHLLLRGAYHLGNRHVPIQLGPGWLAYEHDHVLDDMVRGLGLTVEARRAPFEPEAGAFRHEHGHEDGHEAGLTVGREHGPHDNGHHEGGAHRHL
jgi:urease accessory protein